MARRSRSREVSLQVLYRDDVNPSESTEQEQEFLQARLKDDELVDFCQSLIFGVRRNQSELDTMLNEIASNWSLKRMAVTDRNILRMAAYEILYTETPGRVAINEAVELAKRFGAKSSSHFVNGILDKILQARGQRDTSGK